MASKVILLVVAAYTVISLCIAQKCSESQQVQYVFSLPNGLSCGTGLKTVNDTLDTALRNKALDTICVATCAGAIAKWLSSECNDTSKAAGLTFWCQPADNGRISRCIYALDRINETLLRNQDIMNCTSFNGSACPENCNTGLQRLSDEIGCCFTNIYGNADFRNSLETMDNIFFTLLSNQVLWNSCNIDYPKPCTSEPFPGMSEPFTGMSTPSPGGSIQAYFSFSLGITIALCVLTIIF